MYHNSGNTYILDKKFTDIVNKTYYGNFAGGILEENSSKNRIIMVSSVAGLGLGLYIGFNPLIFSILGGITGLLISNISKND